jgi:putative ABC transport system ATP-binding protein
MGLLEGIQRERGMALVVITHEPEIARRAKRRIELRDGLIVADGASA